MTLKPGLSQVPETRLHETMGECDRILAVLRQVDLVHLQSVAPRAAQAVAEARDRLRDIGAK